MRIRKILVRCRCGGTLSLYLERRTLVLHCAQCGDRRPARPPEGSGIRRPQLQARK